jgi:hypothetical protein
MKLLKESNFCAAVSPSPTGLIVAWHGKNWLSRSPIPKIIGLEK